MNKTPYVIFRLHGLVYGINATATREMFYLPELTHVEEAPPYIAGVLNYRGAIVPVVDLLVRFGHRPAPYSADDAVIVFEANNCLAGIICGALIDLLEIEGSDIDAIPAYAHDKSAPGHFLKGEAKVGDDIVMLLDHEAVVRHTEDAKGGFNHEEAVHAEKTAFAPGADARQGDIFKARAHNLRMPFAGIEALNLRPIAVLSLCNEYFGVELKHVKEFSDIKGLAPVPCCPPHIYGNMNLRGNVITLVDIRGLMGLKPRQGHELKKAVVAFVEGATNAGIVVEDVLQVAHLRQDAFRHEQSPDAPDKGFSAGTVLYDNRVLTVIDMKKIMLSKDLVVDLTV